MARSSTPSTNSAVGKEVLAYCTSCKMDLGHLVAAMQGDRIAKVECKTCKKTHVYKAPKGITEPAKKKGKKSKSDEPTTSDGSPVEAEWEKLMATHRDAPFKSYSTKGNYILGDKLKHPTFGDGIVGKLIYPNKLEVIFQKDVKILIHGGALQ